MLGILNYELIDFVLNYFGTDEFFTLISSAAVKREAHIKFSRRGTEEEFLSQQAVVWLPMPGLTWSLA